MWWLGRQTNSAGEWKIRTLRDGVQVLAKQFDDLGPLMTLIGEHLKLVSQVAFLNQSFDGKKWPERAGSARRPSILGAVADLTHGASISASHFTGRPALVNTGALRASIRYLPGVKTVRVISTEPTEKVTTMNDGGTASLPVTATVKNNLATLLRGHPELRPGLGFLFRRTEVLTEVPARRFLGVAAKSKAKIEELTRNYLEAAAESAREASDGNG